MHQRSTRTIGSVLTAIGFCALASAAEAETLYVANNGVDVATSCGPKASPCRSISQAIANAVPFDTIVVGPGRYGDLDNSGSIGGTGEENGAQCPSRPCFPDTMIHVKKRLIIRSSHGAAETVIDARFIDREATVTMSAGGEFGRPGYGFTVTQPGASSHGNGISIESGEVKVRGNQVIASFFSTFPGNGIFVAGPGPVLVEGNQVVGWDTGIWATGAGKTIGKNQVALNVLGIHADGFSLDAQILGNVATANGLGIVLSRPADVVGNAANGNQSEGFRISGFVPNSFAKNNMVGNGEIGDECGVRNQAGPPLDLANNYWGAATGPGAAPANLVCENVSSTTTPFAIKPFTVKAPIKP